MSVATSSSRSRSTEAVTASSVEPAERARKPSHDIAMGSSGVATPRMSTTCLSCGIFSRAATTLAH